MNILIVFPSFNTGGAEKVNIDIVRGLYDLGHNVSLFTLSDSGPLKEFIPSDIKIESSTSKRAIFSLFTLSKVIKNGNFDIVFCSLGYMSVLTSLSKFISGSSSKIIFREASTPSVSNKRMSKLGGVILKFLVSKAYSYADLVIAPCQFVKSDIHDFYGSSINVKVMYNPLDLDNIYKQSLEPCNYFDDIEEEFIFAALGRLHEVKDYPTMLTAFSKIDSIKRCRLFIIGDGPEFDNLSNLCRKLGIKDKVDFIGHCANPFKYLKHSNVFLHTSILEGLPNAIIQASILDNFILATRSKGGVSELLPDENLVDIGDVEALKDKINTFIKIGKGNTVCDIVIKNNLDFCKDMLEAVI
ncbi:glycosyltransferase [Grimontia hollisae]|uniref:glycosyltransferase n=1 Tax=Grimontia hollisae TaxID=673 RepID=UPI001303CCCF|nr:glycosyltransferase [Grimontia hollisae]